MRKINITQKLKVYNTIVKIVLTYNMSTWGLTKNQTEQIDRLHRKQLRQVWNDKSKKNKDLYKESNERPINEEMNKERWKVFGHMLRLPENTPCEEAMRYYFEKPSNAKKFRDDFTS